MPLIPNFPPDLLMEHSHWHRANHHLMMNPPIGYGLEFLNFHRDFIRRTLAWYEASGLDLGLVQPWPAVPEPIRRSNCYNLAAEDRIVRQLASFRSADELGRFILATGLHGCMHQQAALWLGEPELNDFDLAAQHTAFYQIHGLIDGWFRAWESLGQFRAGITHWCGRFDSDDEEVLYFRPQDDSWWLGKWHPSLHRVAQLEWSSAGSSRMFGPLGDDRPVQVLDVDGDGRDEIMFFHPDAGVWKKGKLYGGRIRWETVRTV